MTPTPQKVSVDHFSRRVLSHQNTAWQQARLPLGASPKQFANPQVIAAKDSLLVSQVAFKNQLNLTPQQLMQKWLPGHKLSVTNSTRVFDGAPGLGRDIEVWQLAPSLLDIFDVVRRLRNNVFHADPRAVSPNHVLIPCPNYDSCPHGPPAPWPQPLHPPLQPPVPGGLATVIDAGYIWGQQGKPPWGSNPLYPTSGPHGLNGSTYSAVAFAQWQYNLNWQPAPPVTGSVDDATNEAPDEGTAGTLDRIAGHANFVAGIVAQRCPGATIDIWSHNAGFDPSNAQFPTEAAVARSLWQSQQSMSGGVIQLGFAFEPYQGIPSTAWDTAFGLIDPHDVVVCPVGNQGDTTARYPAAFFNPPPLAVPFTTTTVKQFPNVVGVASIDKHGQPSSWTNRGSWVACSTGGENVASTFLDWNGPIEDPNPGQSTNFSGWAKWSGTSFAAPRVGAQIANFQMANGGTPAAALYEVLFGHPANPTLAKMLVGRHMSTSGVGIVLPQLP
jgi:subtilase family protein